MFLYTVFFSFLAQIAPCRYIYIKPFTILFLNKIVLSIFFTDSLSLRECTLMLIQDQQFVFICTIIALLGKEKKWRCILFVLFFCSGCSFTPLAEQHLHHLGVSQGGKVAQVLLIAGNLPQDSPHDLP